MHRTQPPAQVALGCGARVIEAQWPGWEPCHLASAAPSGRSATCAGACHFPAAASRIPCCNWLEYARSSCSINGVAASAVQTRNSVRTHGCCVVRPRRMWERAVCCPTRALTVTGEASARLVPPEARHGKTCLLADEPDHERSTLPADLVDREKLLREGTHSLGHRGILHLQFGEPSPGPPKVSRIDWRRGVCSVAFSRLRQYSMLCMFRYRKAATAGFESR